MFRAILFDLGDTLLDFEPINLKDVLDRGSRAAYHRLMQTGAPKIPPFKRYVRSHLWLTRAGLAWSQISGRDFSLLNLMWRLERSYGVPDDPKLKFEIGWEWYKPLVDYSRIESDLLATLQLFRAAGIKIGIVSNTYFGGVLLDHHLELTGLLEYLPLRIYSSETGHRKPSRKIFTKALEAVGERAEDVLFVGDVVRNDVYGAGRMGMKTALKQPLSVARTHVQADYIIRRISELVPIVLPAEAAVASRA